MNEKLAEFKEASMKWQQLKKRINGGDSELLNSSQVEEALNLSQRLLKSTFASLEDAIFIVDAKTVQIIECNPAASEIFGYSREDLIGQTTTFLHVDEPSLEEFRSHLYGAVREQGLLSHLEFKMRRKDGRVFPTEHTVVPLKDEHGDLVAWVSVVCDITERKQTEEALRDSEERFRNLFETVSDVIFSLSENGTITSLNPAFEKITGWPRTEWVGKSFAGLFHPEDLLHTLEAFRKVTRGESLPTSEFRFLSKSGDYLIGELTVSVQIKKGKVSGLSGIIRDVTDRRRFEGELKENERKFRVLTETAASAIFIHQGDKFLYVNPASETISGYRQEELLSMNFWDMVHPDFQELVKERSQGRLIGESVPSRYELKIITKSGEERWVDMTVGVIEYEGKPALLGTSFDISDRKRAEESLRGSEEKYRLVVQNAGEAILVAQDGMITFANPKAFEIIGHPKEEFTSRPFVEFIHPDDREMVQERHLKRLQGAPLPDVYVFRIVDAKGHVKWVEINAVLITWERRPATLSFLTDVTERKEAEAKLRVSEQRYRALAESAQDFIFIIDRNGEIQYVNTAGAMVFGSLPEKMKGQNIKELFPPEIAERQKQSLQEVFESGKVLSFEQRTVFPLQELWLDTQLIPLRNEKGEVSSLLGISRDITQRKQTLDALRVSEEKYRTILENIEDGYYEVDLAGNLIFFNDSACRILGYSKEELRGMNNREYSDLENARKLYETFNKVYRTGSPAKGFDWEIIRKDGSKRHIEASVSLVRDASDQPIGFRGIVRDITERKRVEEEKAALQEQLRQSQRMEAIGFLAGGIAHDFNNLLTVVKGYGQLSLLKLKGDSPLKKDIEEIQNAAERAANLTRQLLAFSRRQVMEMKVINLNTLLVELKKMLRRVLGEDIELITQLSEDLGRVKADPGQLEQVILNLAVNARDAMPTGGRLTIETTNVELDDAYARTHIGVKPGSYVMLAIGDTGLGMTPEVKSRIFEPFFTTKVNGRGTGLGLSTVYGIVQQSEGNIWVFSDPGKGTRFEIYLPRIEEEASFLHKQGESEFSKPGSETILLVEDEAPVRNLVAQILRAQGYHVFEASDGEEALRVYEEQCEKEIHLVLTDVVMPQMGGKKLADRIKALRPEVKVLFTSGYTGDTIAHHGILEPNIAFLQKPFSPTSLTRKVREVLDG